MAKRSCCAVVSLVSFRVEPPGESLGMSGCFKNHRNPCSRYGTPASPVPPCPGRRPGPVTPKKRPPRPQSGLCQITTKKPARYLRHPKLQFHAAARLPFSNIGTILHGIPTMHLPNVQPSHPKPLHLAKFFRVVRVGRNGKSGHGYPYNVRIQTTSSAWNPPLGPQSASVQSTRLWI